MIITEKCHQGEFHKIPQFDIGFFSLELAQKFLEIADSAIAQYGNYINFNSNIWHIQALCWEQHGYHNLKVNPPDWYPKYLQRAKDLTPHVKKPELEIQIHEVGPHLYNFWIIDTANPWVLPSSTNLEEKNLFKSKEYIQDSFAKTVRLYVGTITAWRYYQQLGEAVLPTWIPDGGLMQHQADGKPKKIYKRCPADFA